MLKNLIAAIQKFPKELNSTFYLKTLEIKKIKPNFWCSSEYFKKANLKIHFENGWLWFMDDNVCVLPPLFLFTDSLSNPYPLEYGCWSDFIDYNCGNYKHKKFLDYEYIFDPKSFLSMKGGDWGVFRKNSKKWLRNNLIIDESTFNFYYYLPLSPGDLIEPINKLFIKWLKNKTGVIEDDKTMTRYIYYGENRKALFNPNGEMIGLNIWDENYMYINYRYSICNPEPWLSEYMRLLFYTDSLILDKNKLVNDGGVLGIDSLQNFKDKMNPVQVRKVHSRY